MRLASLTAAEDSVAAVDLLHRLAGTSLDLEAVVPTSS